jgi:tellurite resistance-related uncharacterized protein
MFIDRGPALPDGAWAYRTIGPFAADTIPAGLLRMHNLKAGAWGVLTVEAGAVRFCWDDDVGGARTLAAGDAMLVPPLVPHHLERTGPVTLRIAFHAPPA